MNTVSVSGKNWISKEFNSEEINFFKTNYFLDEIVAKLLSIRKIKKEEIKFFLDPSIKNILPNPYILKDMDKAIERTEKAILNTEKIGVFGDYDVDGATSTAILGKYFEFLNPLDSYRRNRLVDDQKNPRVLDHQLRSDYDPSTC